MKKRLPESLVERRLKLFTMFYTKIVFEVP